MKQPKPKQPIIVAGLYLVSFLLFFIASFLRSTPVLVFSLTYQPLNITTTATADDGFIILSELNQNIELPIFAKGTYRFELTTSGGIVVDSFVDNGLATFTLTAGQQTLIIVIHDLIGEQHLIFQQSTASSLTLTMTNFVNINQNLFYGMYVQDIQVYKI
jgi:hypothetical protein